MSRTRLDSLLLRVLTGIVSLLCVSFLSWTTWATVALFDLQRDMAVLKSANHLVMVVPSEILHPRHSEPTLAIPGLGWGLFIPPPPANR